MFLQFIDKFACDSTKLAGSIFPTNPDLANILGRTDFNFENFHFFPFFGPQISGFPGPQISKFPDFQVPSFPDAACAAAAGRTLRSQPDPYPNAPRDQILTQTIKMCNFNYMSLWCDLRAISKLIVFSGLHANCEHQNNQS